MQKRTISNAVVGLTLDYLGGNFEYLNDTLDAIYLADAKLVLDKGTPKEYQYYLRDNVGNNRLVFRDSLGIPTIVNESHYYPNGGLMSGAWQQNAKAKYLFNGIERVNDFGLDVYHAKYRTLDQWTGRWWQIDPEVEQFYAWSPYNQNFGNSVINSDPEGDCPKCFLRGVGRGIENTVTGVVNAVIHPIETLESLGNAVIHPIETGKAIVGAVSDRIDEAQNTEGGGYELAGEIVFEVAAAALAATKVSKAAKVGKASNLTKSELKSIKSLKKQIKTHKNKLKEFKKNPEKFGIFHI